MWLDVAYVVMALLLLAVFAAQALYARSNLEWAKRSEHGQCLIVFLVEGMATTGITLIFAGLSALNAISRDANHAVNAVPPVLAWFLRLGLAGLPLVSLMAVRRRVKIQKARDEERRRYEQALCKELGDQVARIRRGQ